jgi:glutamate synthase (NADPH/NADH) large chain
MVDLFKLGETGDDAVLKEMIEKHLTYTDSLKAAELLNNWASAQQHFVKVYPREYHEMVRVTEELAKTGLSGEALIEKAFVEVIGEQTVPAGKGRG